MGIFDRVKKEETELEKFINSTKDIEIQKYLLGIKNGETLNPFGREEVLFDVIKRIEKLDNKEKLVFGSNINEIVNNLTSFYINLAPLKSMSDNIEKIEIIFLSTISSKGINHYVSFDKELYNLISDKDTYTIIINSILEDETLIKNIDNIKEYIINNRQYFNSDNFRSNIYKVLSIIKTRGTLSIEMKEELNRENKKRNGIYKIDETTLPKIDEELNDAKSIMETLKVQMQAANILSSLIDSKKNQALSSFDDMIKILDNKINALVENASASLSLAYNEYLQLERSKLTSEKDEIVRSLIRTLNEESGKIRGLREAISDSTSLEIQRIRTEGNAIIEELKQLINNNPKILQLLDSYKDNESLIDSLRDIKTLSSEVNLKELQKNILEFKGVSGDIVINKREENQETIPQVSFYLDNSKKFKDRIAELKIKKEKKIFEGNIYHELFDDVLTLTIEGANPYLWGPSGSGKTFMIRQIAELLELPLYDLGKINESYDILGYSNINGEYNKPLFFQSYLKGGIALADELDAANPNAVIILNNFAAGNKEYNFPYYGRVERHPNFRIMTAGNTCGDGGNIIYNGRFKVEESLQQRLTPIELKYDDKVDKMILSEYKEWFEFSQLFRKAVTEISKIEYEGNDQGNFTTRDAALVKQIKDNESLPPEKIILYLFVQKKTMPYLNELNRIILSNSSEIKSNDTKKLIKTFGSIIESKGNNE